MNNKYKRLLDPEVVEYILCEIKLLPVLSREEIFALIPMFKSEDRDVVDCAAEILYNSNWTLIPMTVSAFVQITEHPLPDRLVEIQSMIFSNPTLSKSILDDDYTRMILNENSRIQ